MITLQRAALYSVFDAVEQDLVEFVRSNICNKQDSVLTPDEIEKARKNLVRRGKIGYNTDSHLDLIYGLDLSEKCDVVLRHTSILTHQDIL